MTSRRKFLSQIGVTVASPTILLSQEKEEQKHSRWELIFNNDEIQIPKFKPNPKEWSNDTITVAWLGHATLLINFFGTIIITDPVFADRVGIRLFGFFKIGPKRLVAPALSFDELPTIDLMLLSHAHFDHLDIPTLHQFDDSIPIVMAKNTSDVIRNLDKEKVKELDWGEKFSVAGIEIEALEVKHFGWRYPWKQDRSRGNFNGRSYNAYLLSKNGKHIVFGGDTSNQDFFLRIRERKLEIELAIMPIGAYDPWIMNHASPEQSLNMAEQMSAKYFLPIHWSTFRLSNEPTTEPIERLKKAMENSSVQLALDSIGQTWIGGKNDV
jgi:L-ascorbate metabolism protein UlaG (beta-lactamase superfamily)